MNDEHIGGLHNGVPSDRIAEQGSAAVWQRHRDLVCVLRLWCVAGNISFYKKNNLFLSRAYSSAGCATITAHSVIERARAIAEMDAGGVHVS